MDNEGQTHQATTRRFWGCPSVSPLSVPWRLFFRGIGFRPNRPRITPDKRLHEGLLWSCATSAQQGVAPTLPPQILNGCRADSKSPVSPVPLTKGLCPMGLGWQVENDSPVLLKAIIVPTVGWDKNMDSNLQSGSKNINELLEYLVLMILCVFSRLCRRGIWNMQSHGWSPSLSSARLNHSPIFPMCLKGEKQAMLYLFEHHHLKGLTDLQCQILKITSGNLYTIGAENYHVFIGKSSN